MPPERIKRKQSASSSATGSGGTGTTPSSSRTTTSGSSNGSTHTQTVTIKVRKPNPRVDPLVVSFPGGLPSNPRFTWRATSLNQKAAGGGRVVEGHDVPSDADHNYSERYGTCVYRCVSRGNNDHDDGRSGKRRTKLCVGIYDKQAGTLTLHQAASEGTVYALQQHLPSYREDLNEVENSTLSKASLFGALFADFGSAKKRKVLKSQQDNRVNVDAVIGAGSAMVDSLIMGTEGVGDGDDDNTTKNIMSESNRKAVEQAQLYNKKNSNKVSGTPMLTAAEVANEELRKSLLPPFHKDADKVYDVFDFQAILGEDAWTTICRMVKAILKKTNADNDTFLEVVTRGRPDDSGYVPPPEKRGWNPSTLEILRHVMRRGIPEKAQSEPPSKAESSRASATHQIRCTMVYHFLAKFYTKFHGSGAASKQGRVLPGLEEEQPRWFGIPREGAQILFDQFATVRENRDNDNNHKISVQDQKPPAARRHAAPNADVPRYMMPSVKRDKCLIHILLVYLMARGGSKMMVEDITPVVDDLGLDAKAAGNLLRMAGCTVSTPPGTKKIKAVLKVPLTFPKVKRGGGRGGGK